MGRGTFSASNYFSGTPPTAYPITISAWIYNTNVAGAVSYISMLSETNDYLLLLGRTSGAVSAISFDLAGGGGGSVTASADTTTGLVVNNTWTHVAAVFGSATSRSVYAQGGNKVTNTTNVVINVAGLSLLELGVFRGLAGSTTFSIAEFGLWNVALSDVEIASLGKGFSCHLIRPASLVHHMPGVRSNVFTRGDLAQTGTVGAANTHPPIIGAIAA